MTERSEQRVAAERGRLYALLAAMLAALALLGAHLWVVQVWRGPVYRRSLTRQSLRALRLPAERGRILERHGRPLAANRPAYNLVLSLESLRQPGRMGHTVAAVLAVLRDLTPVVGRPPDVTEGDIWNHVRRRLPLPLPVWLDLDQGAIARLLEWSWPLAGVDIEPEPVRTYPEDMLAAHVVGFVGRAMPSLEKDGPDATYDYALPEAMGRAGLELSFDTVLRGRPGTRLLRVDASGFRRDVVSEESATAGGDILLTLDLRVQRLAEEALSGAAGAVVVLEPASGEVLALASSPGWNPNRFVPVLSPSLWKAMNEDPDKAMLNRAVSEVYAPGSVFKPVVALAALASGRVNPDAAVDCPGYFALGGMRMRCWNPHGHGAVAMRKAIEQSCNTYFAHVGLETGIAPIRDMARAVGLGERTGIELPSEATGLVPDDQWKRRVHKDSWRPGDTCNVSIGQGALAVTCLQMAVLTAALANGGTWRPPRLVRGIQPGAKPGFRTHPLPALRRLPCAPRDVETVRMGMRDVIMASSGTGGRARIPGVEMAGKTGTAEYGPKEEGRKHGWMIVFAPYDQPRYAVAMVLDDAISGGVSVAPRIQRLMQGLFSEEEVDT